MYTQLLCGYEEEMLIIESPLCVRKHSESPAIRSNSAAVQEMVAARVLVGLLRSF